MDLWGDETQLGMVKIDRTEIYRGNDQSLNSNKKTSIVSCLNHILLLMSVLKIVNAKAGKNAF